MARPSKPTALKDVTGAHKKNPKRRPANEPRPRLGIGPACTNPATEYTAVWDEVVAMVCPGVLGNSDRLALEILCHLIIQFRKNPTEFASMKLSRMEAIMGKFGMTPADRNKIKMPTDEPEKKPEDAYF